ncbi:MAG TPA: 2-oxoacid:ferredoxin oxidoreductase subunit gamma [Candidatus Cloacimonetes bacterium]|nr:2-oxoacid:acceptor oxidoreductase family protein [Candidatus Cloacimonadota bacterium]HHE40784.1 2-oxoacid:ferredoxin oxidoreductase subunit gamma [Candidatus Cloacimonadota bacterium]
MKNEIRLSGSGGQGLILAGIILAEAAIMDGKKVLQSQSYGPESRGGSSRADVIISNETIYFPRAVELDILLSLTQEAADKYLPNLKSNGYLFYDSSSIKVNPIDGESIGVPFTELAIKNFKKAIVTNIISLAFLCRVTEIVSMDSLKEAIKNRVKARFIDMNMEAVSLGIKLAEKYLSERD